MNDEFSKLVEYFREEVGGNMHINEESRVLDSWLQTEYGGVHLVVQAVDDTYTHILFSARSLLSVPPGRREESTKLMNMINWKLILGNFEMDPSDGELAYRTTYCLCEAGISQEQFSHGFNNCMLTSLHNYALFQKVIWNNSTAEEIFRENLLEESANQEITENSAETQSLPENYAEEAIQDITESFRDALKDSE